MKIDKFNMSAKKLGEIEVSDSVFGVEFNGPLVHQVVVAQLANKRQGTKSTLTRSEVRGGGKKPWRQKGTGRARQGSIRAPQWTGGGVVFAPKPRDFSQKINKKMKKQATLCALSVKVSDGNFIVVDDIKLEEIKTKVIAGMLSAFGVTNKTLIVTADLNEKVYLSARNIPGVTITVASDVNVCDLMASTKCIVTEAAVRKMEQMVEEAE